MLQELKLTGFPFSSLNKSIFDNLHQLKHLILDDNNIETLSSVTRYLPKLENLQGLSLISYSLVALRETDCLVNENHIGNTSFMHFNISYLNIDGKQIFTLENNSLCNFPKLSFFKPDISYSVVTALKNSGIQVVDSFSFSSSQFPDFNICMYTSLFKIQELQLAQNRIKFINTSKGSCNLLRILDLSYNSVKNVTASQMKKLKNLKELNLSNNIITAVEICSENVSMELVHLNLSFNYLASLTEDEFQCLKKLKSLSLNHNKIQTIGKYSFRGLKTLEVLHLNSNYFYSLAEFSFSGLFSLKQLILNENFLEEINDWVFQDLRNLEEIAIAFKDMVSMSWSQNMESLKKMSLKTLDTMLTIESEYFNIFNDFESLSIDSHHVFIDKCDEFPFHKVKELYLTNVYALLCRDAKLEIALGKFTNLDKIYLIANVRSESNRNIFNSNLQNLTKLSFFHFENTNELYDFPALNVQKLFLGLKNLQILHLVNSGIEDYGSNVLFRDLKSVRFLIIENERIYGFPDNVFADMISLKYVFLPDTSFICKCEFAWLGQWVKSETQVLFLNFYDQHCFVNTQIQYPYLISFLEQNCHTELCFIAFLVTLIGTLIFMCISVFYESIWWYILYMFYTIKCWLSNRHRKRGHYEYDVFVSYNVHDEQWVTEQLLHNLEQIGPPFFKVCIHNRDFEIGRDIVENIVDSIYNSRWTICVITHSYLQSNWCSLEIRMATYRLVAESKDSLILVFLDDIPREELQYYQKLTKILDKKTYLKWPEDADGQQLFWARLRKVISNTRKRIK
ncbi:toll-like receptor 2 type-2 [Ranitomeya variabilis]|uniref:toll-like receptor 2 type-2 n=1 Tax=Ranitomeya variabilis TaxID=490064 RepID=UPI004056B1A5